ncbi:hypothetical protein C809_00703 [Lachnospiraceae bacterium MD335]|nr:hypothetical protein C809_00703 [Lachnospiraceae bacterium MD335]
MKRPLCSVCLAFVAAVFVYVFSGLPPLSFGGEAEGSRLAVTGELYNKEYKNDSLVLSLKHVKIISSEINSFSKQTEELQMGDDLRIICYLDDDACLAPDAVKLGMRIAVEGEVSLFQKARNPGAFDAADYYRALGISFRLFDAQVTAKGSSYSAYHEGLYQLRRYFEGVYDAVLSEEDAAVLKAMVLGNKAELDPKSKQLFQRSGISHILAISGLHISLIGMMIYGIFQKLNVPRIPSAFFCIVLMTAYGDLIGMSGSAYRAVFMFGMKLLADMLRRTYDMLTALSLAAVLLLLEQPLYLRQSGFLLSFGAVLGIGLFSEMVCPDLDRIRSKVLRKTAAALCGSLSIFLVHFPILLCCYYEFPLYSFFLNLIIIPAMGVLLVMGLICLACGCAGGLLFGAAKLAGVVCHVILAGFETAGSSSLRIPLSQWIVGKPDSWRIFVFYAAALMLYAMYVYAGKVSKTPRASARGIRIGVPYWYKMTGIILAVSFLSFHGIYDTCVTFLDVGQGDGIWVESISGKHYLIDCGSTSESQLGQYTLLPFLKFTGTSRLDAVFLTHLDEDHISGVRELLEDYGDSGASGIRIGRIVIAKSAIKDEPYHELKALCEEKGIPLLHVKAGDVIGDETLSFEVLHPDENYLPNSRNAYSLVLRLSVNDNGTLFHALLTGDVEADGEERAAEYLEEHCKDIHMDLYKAAHHGSKYSNTQTLVDKVHPALTIISCGEKNRYGHPHAEAVRCFEQTGSKIAVTKDTGAVTVRIRDGRCRVEFQKQE